MSATDLMHEIQHSTDMLRAAMHQYAGASAGDLAHLRNEVLFWHGNRARARAWLAGMAR